MCVNQHEEFMFSQQLSSNLRSFVPNDSLEERTTHTHTHKYTKFQSVAPLWVGRLLFRLQSSAEPG